MSTWIKAVARSGVAAAAPALLLVACGDGDKGPIGPQTYVVAVVSGDNQPGKAGRQLGHPFVVRVTNDRGEGLRGMTVTWTVTSGEGAFTDPVDYVEIFDEHCRPAATTSVRTDAEGLARASFMPTWLGPVTVTARTTGASNPVTFTTDASDGGALLRIVAGNHLEGKAGEWFDGLRYPDLLEVLVTDGQGNPVPYVAVTWAITSGDAWLHGCAEPGGNPALQMTRTRPDGISLLNFVLTTFGTSTVAAAVPGVLVSPVTFTVNVTAVVINLGERFGGGGSGFFGPDPSLSSDVTVPIGATVEWVNHFETARIASTSAPPGGASFDSGELGASDRFEFVPTVAGTWEYVDQVSRATGTLTAR
jgi:hypothetical protein